MVEAAPPPALEAEIRRILDRYAAGENPGAQATVAASSPVDTGPSWPLPLLVALLAVVAVGGTTVWIRVAQPRGGEGASIARKDIVMKGSSIDQNAPPPPPDDDPPAIT